MCPFKYVAAHVIQTPRVGLFAACRLGFVSALAAVDRYAVDAFTAAVGLIGAGSAGVFPFSFAGQAVALTGLLVEPTHVGLGVVPVHTCYWVVVALAKTRVAPVAVWGVFKISARPYPAAVARVVAADRDKGGKLTPGDLMLAQSKAVDADAVLGIFTISKVFCYLCSIGLGLLR